MRHTYSKEYLRGFLGTLAKYAAAGFTPSDALAVKTLPPGGRYNIRAAKTPIQRPPKYVLRPGGAQYRAPAWSAEGRLNDAAATALKATPAVLSAPAAAALGGINGVAAGLHDGNGAAGTALRGVIGAGTAFIPGNAGIVNSATGVIESASGGAISGM